MSAIYVDKKGRRITLRSSAPLPGFKSAIPGAYATVEGYWTVPLSIESCVLLRQKYGNRLQVSRPLMNWARTVQRNRRTMRNLAERSDARLTVLPRRAPKLYKAMARRKYQRVGARFVADNHATLVADEPGLGKTLIAMGGILESQIPGPYLIIAPKTASETVWKREIERWLPSNHRAITVPDSRTHRERILRRALPSAGPYTWIIIHPEMVMTQTLTECVECKKLTALKKRTQKVLTCGHIKTPKCRKIDQHNYPKLFDVEWGVILIDESHESLIRRSGTPTQRRNGMDKLKLRSGGMKLAMSGTPFDSKPHQLWGTLNWLDPQTYSAFHRWVELFWNKTGYNGYDIGEFRSDREKLLWDSLSAVALRRTKAEVASDLPPKQEVGTPLDPHDESSPIGVWLEMEPKQQRAYDEMEKLSAATLDSGRLEAITALAELTRLKQLASSYGDIETKRLADGTYSHRFHPTLPSNKFTWTANSLEEWGYPRNPITKVVIVSFYTGILLKFAEELETFFKTKTPMCTAITGRTSQKDRKAIIDRFNNSDTEHVMMLNVKAGGTAITLDTADRMIFISRTRTPDKEIQAEDRIHRVSNPRQCMYYYLNSLGTVDVGTTILAHQLIKDSHRLLDQRRGVEYLRQVIDLSKR